MNLFGNVFASRKAGDFTCEFFGVECEPADRSGVACKCFGELLEVSVGGTLGADRKFIAGLEDN